MKKFFVPITIAVAILSMFSCSQQVREPGKVGMNNAFIASSNAQLAKYPLAGFAYKSTQIPTQQWNIWARTAEPIVKDMLSKIPDGYILEVRGHADSSGPEHQEGDKPGNMNISRDRAKAVIKSLESAGIPSSKITYKGLGSSDLIPNIDPRSGRQRRVTFAIVPM